MRKVYVFMPLSTDAVLHNQKVQAEGGTNFARIVYHECADAVTAAKQAGFTIKDRHESIVMRRTAEKDNIIYALEARFMI